MRLRRFSLVLAIGAVVPFAGADEKVFQPTDPATWGGDLVRFMQPTKECAGGTVEQLETRMAVSKPYLMEEFEATQGGAVALKGAVDGALLDADRLRSFSFRSDLPGGTFWGIDGYVVVRNGCVIHAEITSYDN